MLQEQVQPDSRTYAILLRALLFSQHFEMAASLLRGALGLPGARATLLRTGMLGMSEAHVARLARIEECPSLDYGLVNETLLSMADGGYVQELAQPLLGDLEKFKPKVRIDPRTRARVVSGAAAPPPARGGEGAAPWRSNGAKGRGRAPRNNF